MPLRLLPDLVWPLNSRQIEPLNENLVQFNVIEGGLSARQQKALNILFSISDRWVKSGGKLDYRGREGHRKLVEDAMNFVGGSPVVTRHGDLAASHLALDYHDAQCRLIQAGQEQLPNAREALLALVKDISDMPIKLQDQLLVLLDYLAKKPMPR